MEQTVTNPEMRHIPPLGEIIRRLDVIYRKKLDVLLRSAFERGVISESQQAIEQAFARVVRSFDHLAEVFHSPWRHGHPEPSHRREIETGLNHLVACVRSLDATNFRHRNPYHLFEKSRCEGIWCSVLAIGCSVDAIVPLCAASDPDLYERLNELPFGPVAIPARIELAAAGTDSIASPSS